MKTFFFIISLFVFQTIPFAQTNTGKIPAKPKVIIDTIGVCSPVFIGANVICFNATYIRGKICTTRKFNGMAIPEGACALKSGDFIIIDEIVAVDQSGKRIKTPVIKYVIR